MPEGPEVKIFDERIDKEFKNAELKDIQILSGRYKKHGPPKDFNKFKKHLPLEILGVKNKGKFTYICLDKDKSIWITFGMSGKFAKEPDEYSRVLFKTDRGNFYFSDMRNFGTVNFGSTTEELDKKLRSLGPDPLQNKMTDDQFIEIMRSMPNKPIGIALVNQRKISGLGNYLRAEILYDAKISPWRPVKDLSDAELRKIWKSTLKIYQKSYDSVVKGGVGSNDFKVYQRKGKTDKGEVIKGEKMKDGSTMRTIWWAPSVQK